MYKGRDRDKWSECINFRNKYWLVINILVSHGSVCRLVTKASQLLVKYLLYWCRDSYLQYWAFYIYLRVHKHDDKIYKIEYLTQKYWVFVLEKIVEFLCNTLRIRYDVAPKDTHFGVALFSLGWSRVFVMRIMPWHDLVH